MRRISVRRKSNHSRSEGKSLGTYFRLIGYTRPYWYLVVCVLFLSMITSLIAILPVQIMGVAVDEIKLAGLDSRNDRAPRKQMADPVAEAGPQLSIAPLVNRAAAYVSRNWMPDRNASVVTFYVLAAFYLCLHFTVSGVSIANGFIGARLGQTLIFDMRNHIYQHLQKLSLRYFQDHRTGDIMSRVVNDVNSLQNVIVGPIIQFITNVLTLCWVLYLCLLWDWGLTVLSLVIGPLLASAMFIFGQLIRKVLLLVRRKVGELNALLYENLSGIRVIKGFAREEHELGRFKNKNRENMNLNIKVARMYTIFSPVIRTLTSTGSLIVLLYGGIKVVRGELTPGMFIVFFPYIRMLYRPITGLSGFYRQMQTALASVERVFEVLDTEPDIKNKEDALDVPQIRGEIELKNVHFSYPGDAEVLRGFNLRASPGQMIAFVGPSGAGKTTVTNLIPRFYDPTEGEVLVDGYNLKDVRIESLRKQIGMVLQEPFLFNDTVKNNISYGKLEATDEEITDAAKAANAHDFITELPGGYDTVISERGMRLSVGQRQRISIARAILSNPRILILDEATSSVDTETELLIQDAIQKLVKDRTTFVIAHRLSTVHNADLIFVLDRGEIAEVGNHEELLKKGGIYKRLYEIQFRTPDEDRRVLPSARARSIRQRSVEDENLGKMLDKMRDMLEDETDL
jgi:subfamily B ATP-binding cassette protein MsbA